VVRRRNPGSLLVVHDHFLQIELTAVLMVERQVLLAREGGGVEREQLVGMGSLNCTKVDPVMAR
jgi:hypothetical protein